MQEFLEIWERTGWADFERDKVLTPQDGSVWVATGQGFPNTWERMGWTDVRKARFWASSARENMGGQSASIYEHLGEDRGGGVSWS